MVHDLPAMQESAQGQGGHRSVMEWWIRPGGGARAGSAQAEVPEPEAPKREAPEPEAPGPEAPGPEAPGPEAFAQLAAPKAVFAVSFHHRHHPATKRLRMACRTG